MSFTYWLPDETGKKVDFTTDVSSIIIIGANGSGKSKLGAWIEQQNYSQVHRIGAQRNLNFNENITLKSYSQAEDFVFYGSDNKNWHAHKDQRWNWGKDYTTKLIDDFENVLAALIGLKNNENDHFVSECKIAAKNNSTPPTPPQTSIDKLKAIWQEVLPERELILEDSKFYAAFEQNGVKKQYSANQMSDGERAVLYLTAQVLCVPQNKTLIIDEPEVHLHRSIMNRLWLSLEKYRTDCLFIFITHDTQFASLHSNAEKIWIKEYDGNNWKLEKINNNELQKYLGSMFYTQSVLKPHSKSPETRINTGFPSSIFLLKLGVFFVVLNYICLSFMQIHAYFYINYIIYNGLLIFCCQNVATLYQIFNLFIISHFSISPVGF